MRERRAIAAFFLLTAILCGPACAGRTPAPTASSSAAPAPTPERLLSASIDRILQAPALEPGSWAIDARLLANGAPGATPLYALNARKLLMPASSLKVLTLAVAADQLGWDFRFRTELAYRGQIADGTLRGDLVVVGGGDPTIDDWSGDATALFTKWADTLKAAGVQRIAGRLIGDDDLFEDDGLGPGWAWDDLAAGYSTRIGALQFNQSTAQIVIAPAAHAGDPASVTVRPPTAPVSVVAAVTTTAAGQPTAVQIRASPRSAGIEARGSIAAAAPVQVRNVAVENPTVYFLNALRDVLVRNGIDVRGPSVDIDEIPPSERHPVDGVLLRWDSPPLSQVTTTMMKLSQNLFAESLLRMLGRSRGGTADAGLAAVQDILARWNVQTDGLRIVDGSGLSRYNVVTAASMTDVLAHVYGDARLRDAFLDTLPVGGRDGTLENRMKSPPLSGNVRAKTGSFSNARALAGYVRDADDETIVFTIMANNFGVTPDVIDEAADAIVNEFAIFKGTPAH